MKDFDELSIATGHQQLKKMQAGVLSWQWQKLWGRKSLKIFAADNSRSLFRSKKI